MSFLLKYSYSCLVSKERISLSLALFGVWHFCRFISHISLWCPGGLCTNGLYGWLGWAICSVYLEGCFVLLFCECWKLKIWQKCPPLSSPQLLNFHTSSNFLPWVFLKSGHPLSKGNCTGHLKKMVQMKSRVPICHTPTEAQVQMRHMETHVEDNQSAATSVECSLGGSHQNLKINLWKAFF